MEKKRCFVIMPFSKTTKKHTQSYWTKSYENFLKPLIEENSELEAHRSTALREDIVRNIITTLVTAPIVVADLTDYNPNVLWELGVRQSFKSGTITIAEEGTQLPFNLSSKGTLFYSSSNVENKEFKINLHKALNDCIKNPNKSDSIVFDTISGRGTISEIIQQDRILKKLDGLILELERNIDYLHEVKGKFNMKGEKSDVFVPNHLSYASLELLQIQRYLDMSKEDYFFIIRSIELIKITNRTLDLFPFSPEIVETMFASDDSTLEKNITMILKLIKLYRVKTEKQL